MIKLLVATFNQGKLKEIRKELEGVAEVISPQDLGIKEKPEEKGSTFKENALEKALFFSKRTELPVFAEDSGLVVPFLGGDPGVRSARFSLEGRDETNIQLLLEKMKGAAGENRKAKFVAWGVLLAGGRLLWEGEEEVWGYILTEKRGTGGFGYDPVFYYPPAGKTFAEMNSEEKNRVSHRGKLIRALREFLLKEGFSGFYFGEREK